MSALVRIATVAYGGMRTLLGETRRARCCSPSASIGLLERVKHFDAGPQGFVEGIEPQRNDDNFFDVIALWHVGRR